MKIDKNIIKELNDYLDEFNLTEIEITEKDTKIKVSKNNVSVSNQPVINSVSSTTQMILITVALIQSLEQRLPHQLLVPLTMLQNLERKNLQKLGKKLKKVIP